MDKSKLFTIYNRARAAARRGALDPDRVNKALGICQANDYYREKEYLTSVTSCTCPDHQYRSAICKHMIGKMIEIRVSEEQA